MHILEIIIERRLHQYGKGSVERFSIPTRLHQAEVIITTENPSALERTAVLMNRYDVITRLTPAKFHAQLLRRIVRRAASQRIIHDFLDNPVNVINQTSSESCSTVLGECGMKAAWEMCIRAVFQIASFQQVSKLLAANTLSNNPRVSRCV